MNLLQETLKCLQENGKSPTLVNWVGTSKMWCDWDTFASLADFDYHNGYGSAEIETSLVVVGDGWWLERWEYDGSEGWSFKTTPTKPIEKLTKKSDLQAETW